MASIVGPISKLLPFYLCAGKRQLPLGLESDSDDDCAIKDLTAAAGCYVGRRVSTPDAQSTRSFDERDIVAMRPGM